MEYWNREMLKVAALFMLEVVEFNFIKTKNSYTLSEAWSKVNWADLMAAQFTLLQASDRV